MTVAKKNITSKLSSDTNLTIKESNDFLNVFIQSIKKNLLKGDQKISNFGTFYNKLTPRRVGRNPRTMEIFTITKRNKISFKISSKIRQYIN